MAEVPQARFVSGETVYDEAFIDGKQIGRYWSDCGQVWPGMHLPVQKLRQEAEGFPLAVFELTVNGKKLDGFTYVEAGEKEEDPTGLRAAGAVRVSYTRLAHPSGIEVDICTRLDGGPFLVRWLVITNKGTAPVGIDSVYPMAGRIWAHNKGLGNIGEATGDSTNGPFLFAYHHLTGWGTEGDFYFEPLPPGETRFDGDRNGKSGWSRPNFWLQNRYSGKTFLCEFAYSGNWEFKLHNSALGGLEQAGFAIGIPAVPGEYCRVLDVHESVTTPQVHAGIFAADTDGIVQAVHDHVRHCIMPKPPAGREIEIEANHRGYLCDRETGEGIRNDIDVAAAIGAELYVIDAGWYGENPNRWWDNVGDWYEGSWMGCSMRSISDYAHQKGMRFGLWIEIEAAGSNSKLRRERPEWIMKREGKPLRLKNGAELSRALDLTQPEVAVWIEKEVIERAINEYNLDMFRIDHNHSLETGGNRKYLGLTENLLWRYYDNLYAIFDHLLKKYPDVVFQNCAGGGGRLDWGIMQRFHNTEMSDWMRPPREVKIYAGLTMALPPERFLRTFGTETSEPDLEPDLDFQLRMISVCRPIFRGIAPSLETLNERLKERIQSKLTLYKQFLRPVIRDCKMFHHTVMQPIMDPADFGVYEFAGEGENKKRSFAALFRLNMEKHNAYVLRPRSTKRDKRYRVCFDNNAEIFEAAGLDLANNGLYVDFYASEIITFEEI
jgi:alpha-galactosidase